MLVLKRHYQFWFAILGLHKLGAIAIPAPNQLLEKDFKYRFDIGRIKAILCTADGEVSEAVDSAAAECPGLSYKIMVGGSLREQGYGVGLWKNSPYVAVKVPVFSFAKLGHVNPMLSPEMKSTGEVLGLGKDLQEALFKGLVSAGYKVEKSEQKEVEPEPVVEEPKPREVNRRALFPGNTPESPAKSQGNTDTIAGNQGYIGGAIADNYEGTGGADGFEPDWDLEGRRPRGEFPRPRYADNEQGIVVVEIWVNGNGDVTGAAFHAKGSTVSAKSPLVAEAIKAAKGVKFSESNQDIQVGTITYRFRLKTGKK